MGVELEFNKAGYFEKRGLDILIFNNWYDGNFSDAKISGIEFIHHGVRTVTNGDIRLCATPEQWDPIPRLIERKVNPAAECVEMILAYPDHNFQYVLKAEKQGQSVLVGIELDKELPVQLEGCAGFNLEFLPSAYRNKGYLADNRPGIFPLYPGGGKQAAGSGRTEAVPFARGRTFVFAPEDTERRVTVQTPDGELTLFDGRTVAQNGWYVLRSLLPAGRKGRVMEWLLTASVLTDWVRQPVIGHSQVGYHPEQQKLALIELDKNDIPAHTASLLQITQQGEFVEKYTGSTGSWGKYLRYHYLTFDFSQVKETGLYILAYGNVRTRPFRIASDIMTNAWQPTLDVFFPVQMDHMRVREAYRIWHGAAHLDDALQAPVNHEHFDLYAQGPTTDTPYAPGEHIPGLNIGGWFDAGDFDIRTQTQYAVLYDLVHTWEDFRPERDVTTVNQENRYVEIHRPDGIPDILQQIEHGTLALLAQFRAFGRAICGIVEPDRQQYTHLGDASVKTDNLVYNPRLKPGESDGFTSSTFDDRWVFTSRSTPLNYGAIASLAAASRALRGYRDELAGECLAIAEQVWEEEHEHDPYLFKAGNITGGQLVEEELKAACELLITTGKECYALRIDALWPEIVKFFGLHISAAVRALPYMDTAYAQKVKEQAVLYKAKLEQLAKANPFGVFIWEGGWAGNGLVVQLSIKNYLLHKAFPEIIDREAVFRGLHFLFGCHPGSDLSFVSGVGASSAEIAYGNNRADYSFIAGGIVPGVLLLKPDFPEHKEDWPFLWGENEYVVNVGAAYIYLVLAADSLLNGGKEAGRCQQVLNPEVRGF